MGDHGHDHAEHEHKHGDGCCGHDHGHAEPADSHEHSHAAPAEEKPSLPERWLSPKQRKGIGRYLKPWGKQPTSATFWIQILTTVAVIIISIAKGADATVALVISTGPAEFQERQNPQFLALGIVTCLFTVVFVAGYIMIKWQRARLEKQAEREAKEAKEAAEAAASKGVQEAAPAGAQEAGSKAEAAPAKAPGKKAARTKASLEIEQREQEEALAQLQAGLESALQQTLASAEADGCKPAETRRRVWAVQQEFADRTQLAKEIHEIINAATVEGCTEDAKKQRCDMHASFFQEMMQMKAHQAQELKAIEQESIKEGCLPQETLRRLDSRKKAQEQECGAQREHAAIIEREHIQASRENLKEEELKARVMTAAAEVKKKHGERAKAWVVAEKKARAMAAVAAKESIGWPPPVRAMLLARVRISGLRARPELNGRCGTAVKYQPVVEGRPGRFAVNVDGEEAPVLLKLANLTRLTPNDEPLDDTGDDADDEPPPLE